LKLWIDADAAPRDVKDVVFRVARRLKVETLLVANQPLSAPWDHPYVSAVRVAGGLDVADQYIADQAEPGDVAVTADIPLAARLVDKGVFVLDPRGLEYTEDNVGEKLAGRDLMTELRSAGMVGGGPRPFGPKDRQSFAVALDRVVSRALRGR
jgi:uncharacterized protein YaiI (UPF0178 family)